MQTHKKTGLPLLLAAMLSGCGPSVGVVGMGGMPMGMGMGYGGMMGMPMGGFAYGGAWGHSTTNVDVYNNRTTDVYASNRTNTMVNDEHVNNAYADRSGDFYHPGRFR